MNAAATAVDEAGGLGGRRRRRLAVSTTAANPRRHRPNAETAQLATMSTENNHQVNVDQQQHGDAADQQADEKIQHKLVLVIYTNINTNSARVCLENHKETSSETPSGESH